MRLLFEWDPAKAAANEAKHGVTFEEALTVFDDERSVTIYDYSHSRDEDRYVDLGRSKNGNILAVVYTERNDRIRIIHARKANREERRFYETNDEDTAKGRDR